MEMAECIALLVVGGVAGAAITFVLEFISAVRTASNARVKEEESPRAVFALSHMISSPGDRILESIKRAKHDELTRELLVLEVEREVLERLQSDGRDEILKEVSKHYCCSGVQYGCNGCTGSEEEESKCSAGVTGDTRRQG